MEIADGMSDEKFDKYIKSLETKQIKAREEMKEIGGEGSQEQVVELTTSEKIAAKAKQRTQ